MNDENVLERFGMVASGNYSKEVFLKEGEEIRVFFLKRWGRLNFSDGASGDLENVPASMVLSEPKFFRTVESKEIIGGLFEIFHRKKKTVLLRVKRVFFFGELAGEVFPEYLEKWNGALCRIDRGGEVSRCDIVLWHLPSFGIVPFR